MLTSNQKNQDITNLVNGTITAFRHVVPIPVQLKKLEATGRELKLEFGIMIGITGDVKGQLVLAGKPEVFYFIGEKMFGMEINESMFVSFSGELGNMIAGHLSTNITSKGINTDITSPVIFQGQTVLASHDKSLRLPFQVEESRQLDIYLLVNEQ